MTGLGFLRIDRFGFFGKAFGFGIFFLDQQALVKTQGSV
jgi:hypothetical protein